MKERVRRIREADAAGDRGFTLMEVLVVVVIIGILAGIAVPVYMNYRKGAENRSAEADLRSAINAVEQYYTENSNVYPPSVNMVTQSTNTPAMVLGVAPNQQTVALSTGNRIQYRNNTTSYVICSQNIDGATIWVYDSSKGKPVGKSTSTTVALCIANGV